MAQAPPFHAIESEYTPRASTYDTAGAGWHATLAADFTSAVNPLPGHCVLDLACGTCLVTLLMAQRVGPRGLVVGVDVTGAMLDVARSKVPEIPSGNAKIEFVQADITDVAALKKIPRVEEVIRRQGGFDVISCCSALVLLPSPRSAVAAWAGLLRPPSSPERNDGGKMIVDVATEEMTVQYLATEVLLREIGIDFAFTRAWVEGIRTLEGMMTDTGLEVERSWKSENYLATLTRWWGEGEGMDCFDQEVLGKYGRRILDEGEGKVSEARSAWRRLWEEVVGGRGGLRDGHWLYITMARRVK